MADPDTDTLRKMAPCWNLAGDERLLTILQNTHQRLISKCQEANSQLEQMATALDEASISLQNVNNQFMALSSSQFIERRVYDDDVEVVTETQQVKESPKLSPPDDLTTIKRSIAVIENTHDVITILQDSDTESDTDDDLPDRLVMKPKDVYADRPLPYIIGSEPWKNKWHAGLVAEDSDTDSSASKVDQESDQYSQSDPEEFDLDHSKVQDISTTQHVRRISETSSELPSESTPDSKPTPSDVANELARRLGGGDLPSRVVEQEPVYEEPPKPVVSKVYKPQEPVASTIFPDEPPPLEQSDSDPDIFADLHRHQPYSQPSALRDVTHDLFGGNSTEDDEGGDIFSDFANQPPPTKPVSLFEAGPTPHMFDKRRKVEELPPARAQRDTDKPDGSLEQTTVNAANSDDGRVVKKPVGGISLFGSNKGTENIGAAILQRNRRKSNTSGEESGNETTSHTSPVKQQTKEEKDIFDDLFAKSQANKVTPKSNNVVKEIKPVIQKQQEETVKKDIPKPVDLFSDNLFDDIDDIFTTSIVKTSKDKQKSIFEDDDDLFSEVAYTKPVQVIAKKKDIEKKSLFDSDDDLFSVVPKHKPNISNKPQSISKVNQITENSGVTKPSENRLKVKEPNKSAENIAKIIDVPKVTQGATSIFDDEDDDLFSNIKSNKEISKVQNSINTGITTKNVDVSKNVFNSPSLFDDVENDENDIFSDSKKTQKNVHEDLTTNTLTVNPRVDEKVAEKDISATNTVSVDSSRAKDDNVSKNNVLPIRNKDLDEVPSKTKDEISEGISTVSLNAKNSKEENNSNLIQSEPIKTEIFNKPNVNDNIITDNTIETLETHENESSDHIPDVNVAFQDKNYELTNNQFIDKNSTSVNNINTTTTEVQKLFDDDNSTNSLRTEQVFNEEYVETTNPDEIPNNSATEAKKINDMETITPHVNIEEKVIHTGSIIKDSSLEEDIFTSPSNISNIEGSKIINTEIPSKPNIETEKEVNKVPNADIFSDILSEPPDFEKPKEPKRSKNVNALFDDDSDDESLFFKRDDVITDEKPEHFTSTQDRLFNMFTNEPPDEDFTKIEGLDDDFFNTLPKPKLPSGQTAGPNTTVNEIPRVDGFNPELEIKRNSPKAPSSNFEENIDDMFIASTKIKKTKEEAVSIFDNNVGISQQPDSILGIISEKGLSDDEELFKSLPAQLPASNTESKSKNLEDSDEELFTSLPPNLIKEETSKEVRQPDIDFKLPSGKSKSSESNSKSDGKKLGKLKVGLNINVNALLPGASPKKVKPLDNIDGQTQSQVEVQKDVPQLPKLVSFGEEPESKVLDNKLSKERPRIQVKRRPSTRKARKEAVRKSGIDFGDDSTDNSSSIDDPPKTQSEIVRIPDNRNNNNVERLSSNEDINIGRDEKYEDDKNDSETTESEDLNLKNEKPVNISKQTDINTNILDNQIKTDSARFPPKSASTTKIVYILNDEDIFNTKPVEEPTPKPEISSNQSTDNEIINSKNTDNLSSSITEDPVIKTLGNTYQSTRKDDSKNSLFGEELQSDDEEMFKAHKPVAKAAIFDSDSDGDLFATKKSKGDKVDKTVKPVKGSLFGDDDDDDLFGVKTSKRPEPQHSSKSTATVKEPPSTTESVFEDPLSMFGDED